MAERVEQRQLVAPLFDENELAGFVDFEIDPLVVGSDDEVECAGDQTQAGVVATALALSISHRPVTASGGELRIDSELGRGTTVHVILPMAVTPEAEAASSTTPANATRRARVMVVDDEAIITATVRRLLSREHDVVTATRAIEALHRIQSNERFDLILCDLMMPQMTGMELHDRIAQIDGDQASRIVFLTGGAFTPTARQFLDRVPNQRIEKPFDAQHLRVLVNDRIR